MALALSYIAPSMVKPLYTTPIGWMLIGVVLILMAAGVYTIHKIVSIEV
jgi:Flp pilus assembly protein TadB